jgi:hypothetical protein
LGALTGFPPGVNSRVRPTPTAPLQR